jgi:23S rRNA (adenine2030-N6)-methyltransferase
MLSYQHAYHAAGPADVHKHAALASLIALLTVKPRGIAYAETHAGRGLYDLAAPEAAKTGEAARGVGRLPPDPGGSYGRALAAARGAAGPRAYPGSPMIARTLLRPQDRLTLMELHPAEHAALRAAMAGDGPPTAIHRRDGFEGLLGLAPLTPRRGLVLVDPSYEVKADYATAADFARRLAPRWPEAAILLWYPLLPAGRHAALLDELGPLRPLRDEVRFADPPPRGMTGSGLALVNPPHGAEAALAAARAVGAGLYA